MDEPKKDFLNPALGLEELQALLSQDPDVLQAVAGGEVDALVITAGHSEQVYTLNGSDRAYRVLFTSLNEGALTLDGDGTVLYANPRIAELLLAPLESLIGQSFCDYVRLPDRDRFMDLLKAGISGNSKGEVELVAPGRNFIPVMLSMNAVSLADANRVATVVVTDLTLIREAEEALRRANSELEARVMARTGELARANDALKIEIAERRRLEDELRRQAAELQRQADELSEADRRKDAFLSTLAHELRNPLAPILNATEALESASSGNPLLERYRRVIARQARNLARLVDDLLDVSRITRNLITLRKQSLDLREIVHRAVESTAPLVNSLEHKLTLSLPSYHVMLHADPTRVEQILVNLVTNSAKYTVAPGEILLEVTAEGKDAVIKVKDSGVGITAELLPHVFELFVQADRTLARSQGGLGIGLTLVKSLVEMHDGSIEAKSGGMSEGSEFVVRLPLSQNASAEPQAARSSGLPSGRSRRILVVDDNPDAAETLSDVLGLWGHEVHIARDGLDGLRVVSQFKPDLVLLDIGLPAVDGYEVARRIRLNPEINGIHLIAVSGYGQAEDIEKSHRAGFDHHLVKPVDPATLQELLARL